MTDYDKHDVGDLQNRVEELESELEFVKAKAGGVLIAKQEIEKERDQFKIEWQEERADLRKTEARLKESSGRNLILHNKLEIVVGKLQQASDLLDDLRCWTKSDDLGSKVWADGDESKTFKLWDRVCVACRDLSRIGESLDDAIKRWTKEVCT